MQKSIDEIYYDFKDRCKLLRNIYKDKQLQDEETEIYKVYNCYSNFEDIMTFEEYRKAKNFDIGRYRKRERCSTNIHKIIAIAKITKAKLVFGTITLNDDFLKENYNTQKLRIQRYIKRSFFYSIKNADYGNKNNRLHYHFIGLTFEELIPTNKKSHQGRKLYNIKNDKWKNGFLPVYEIIPYDSKDLKKISNYIVKLNNHSNKISTKKSRLSILKNYEYLEKINYNYIDLVKAFI